MKDYIQIGIDKGLISFNEDKSRIKYNWQNKERNYNNPEEKVQARTFLQLILDYNYPEKQIHQFESVTMGSEVKEADIVVYEDAMCLKPLIIVECKKQEVSEAEFQQAINQAYSYAYNLPGSAVKSKDGDIIRDSQQSEVLFIEQDYLFLKEGGMLAIVLPDGILTNSSMQYVRTQLEEWFRIVAVVSMPQTAFAANGAGVKSSVLFLKKWPKSHSKELEDQKKAIQKNLLEEANYYATRELWDKEIKIQQKAKVSSMFTREIKSATAIKQTQAYKDWNAELLAKYAAKVDALQSQLIDEYEAKKQKELPDYPIFMAIAEEIGYDATGKKTAVNELDIIGQELKKFINSLDRL